MKANTAGYHWKLELAFSLSKTTGLFEAEDLNRSRGWWRQKSGENEPWQLQQSADQPAKGIQPGDTVRFAFQALDLGAYKAGDLRIDYFITFGRDTKRARSKTPTASPFQIGDTNRTLCVLRNTEPMTVENNWFVSEPYTVNAALPADDSETFEFVVAIEVEAPGAPHPHKWQFGYDPEWCVGRTCP